jgi:ribose 5-phosphate isomerase B
MTHPTIILATDHAGFAHKEAVKKFLSEHEKGYTILDVGAHTLVPEDDYPTYMTAAAMKVAEDMNGNTKAIIFGGSGQGEAIVANRFPGVRAVVWYGGDQDILVKSREHNDANVLSIGARYMDEEAACDAAEVWLDTPFSEDPRHIRRITQIDSIE